MAQQGLTGAPTDPAIMDAIKRALAGQSGDAPHAVDLAGLILGSKNVPQQAPNGAGAAVGGYANGLMGLATQLAGDALNNPQQDPGQQAIDYEGMAAQQYAPQFAALEKAKQDAQNRANTGIRDLSSVFNGLADQTVKQGAAIKGQYDATGKGIQGAWNDAANNVTNNVGKTINSLSAELARLGQGQAAADLFNRQGSELQAALRNLGTQGAAGNELNQHLGQNAQTFNTETANSQRLAGAQAGSDLTRQLQTLMANLDAKGMDLQSQQMQAANQYMMSGRDQALKAQSMGLDQAKLDLQLRQMQLDQQNKDRQFGLDSQTFDLNSIKALNNSKNPADILTYNASKLFGDQQAAANAVDAILNTYQNTASGGNVNFNQFMQEFTKANPQYTGLELRNVQQLALNLLSAVANKNDPVYSAL